MSLKSLFPPEQDLIGPSAADLKTAKKKLTTRRTFLKVAAATGAVAAVYAVPKISSVHSRPAYASVTGGDCEPDFCVAKITGHNADGSPILGTAMSVTPIDFPGSITAFYNYNSDTGKSNSGNGSSSNTPGMDLLGAGDFNSWDGLEEIHFNTASSTDGTLHGNIAMFTLIRTSNGQVHLVTILDSPGDNEGGQARIVYTGLPNNTGWSVEDDPGETANLGSDDAHKDPTKASPDDTPQGEATMDVKWLICCTDGGALTPPTAHPFDCDSKICVEFTHDVNIAGDPNFGTAPICFVYQDTKHHDDWLTGLGLDGAYDDSVNPAAPKIRLRELNSDFCIIGRWE